jgi:pimeloyl-ACP methyl ester carboxylesterase
MIEQGKKQSAEGLAYGHLAMMSRVDHQETLKKASFPVLFLLGTEDDLVPLEKAWQTALLPNISLMEVMEGVAHMGMFEATIQSASVMQSFYAMARLFS